MDTLKRLKAAKTDRSRVQSSVNEAMSMTLPMERRIGEGRGKPSEDAYSDIFDVTMADAHHDFGSDMVDLFTPSYRPWANFKASEELNDGQRREIEPQLAALTTAIFAAIRASNFYEASQSVWPHIALNAGGVRIPYVEPGKRIVCIPVLSAHLLMDHGPDGRLDGRGMEAIYLKGHLEEAFPEVDWPAQILAGNDMKEVAVTEWWSRDWKRRDDDVWVREIIATNKVVHRSEHAGEGACAIIACRWSPSYPSAWGDSPALRALPAARYLNQLEYDRLGILNKKMDPPGIYDEDGVFNPEQGLEAGYWYGRVPGSRFDLVEPRNDASEVLFDREDKRMSVKRAYFQDKPFQRGDTPPSATQWMDERVSNNRRLELPRDRVIQEWVLPIIRRFAWILREQAELPPVELGGRTIPAHPVSPLSKASDAEDANVATQVLQIAQGVIPEQMNSAVDGVGTLRNIKEKLGDTLVVLRSEEEANALLERQMGGPAGEPPA